MKPVKAWAIVGVHGLYEGTGLRRIDMIATHVCDMYASDGKKVRGFAFDRLDPEQRIAWARCRKLGDRCIRVEIRELKPKRKKGASK